MAGKKEADDIIDKPINSPFFKGKPFSVAVSDAIRHHVGMKNSLESKRDIAFDDRDAAIDALNGMQDLHSPEALEEKAKHSDAMLLIDQLGTKIKWHNNQITKCTQQADAEQLALEYEMPVEPPPAADADQMKFDQDERPIGKPLKDQPEVPEGVDQQLAASVNELDIRDDIKAKLIKQNCTTIKALTVLVDSDADLNDIFGFSDAVVKLVKKSLASYRKKHRDAMRDAESGD